MIKYIFQETFDMRRPSVNIYYNTKQKQKQIVPLEIDPLNEYLNEFGAISFMQEAEKIIENWALVFEWFLDPTFKFSSAQTAIDRSYRFGGWSPFEGFSFKNGALSYPGDPDLYPIWKLVRHVESDEEQESYGQMIYGYPHDWVAIVNEDCSFQVARID